MLAEGSQFHSWLKTKFRSLGAENRCLLWDGESFLVYGGEVCSRGSAILLQSVVSCTTPRVISIHDIMADNIVVKLARRRLYWCFIQSLGYASLLLLLSQIQKKNTV